MKKRNVLKKAIVMAAYLTISLSLSACGDDESTIASTDETAIEAEDIGTNASTMSRASAESSSTEKEEAESEGSKGSKGNSDTSTEGKSKAEGTTSASNTSKRENSTTESHRSEATTEATTESHRSENTTEGTTEQTHSHDWVEVYKTVHHDAVTHEEQRVVTEAWDEEVYKSVYICNRCGREFDALAAEDPSNPLFEEFIIHLDTCQEVGSSYHTESILVNTIHHDAVYETVTVVDKEAYDEQVIDYYKCSCGEIKR